MPYLLPARRFFGFVTLLLAVSASARTGALGQDGKVAAAPSDAAPAMVAAPAVAAPPPVRGTGEQMRAIAVVCDLWEETRKREAKTGGRKVRPGGPHDTSDIRDYNFAVTQEDANTYRVTVSPRKPVVEEVPSPQGVFLMNNSSTFFYELRRSDFKIVGVSAIL